MSLNEIFGNLAHVIEGDCKRASNSRLSDQGTLIEGFNAAASTALSSAITNFINCAS